MRVEANQERAIEAALGAAQNKVEELKRQGLIARVEDITDEDELDDHFDDLARVYKQTFLERGLDWPPSPKDDTNVIE